MKAYLILYTVTAILLIASSGNVSAQDTGVGEGIFKQTCAACHSIGRGRLVGPDLANLHERRSQDWVLKFVKSSQSVIKSGDKYADSLFQAFNKTIMPDQPTLSDEQIKDIISYIETKSAAPVTTSLATTSQQSDQQVGNKTDKFFSTTNIFFLGIILFMLLVILSLARINKILLDQIKDYYSSDRAFFK